MVLAGAGATGATGATERRRWANAVRALSMDAVQKAGSGHPGAPMGMADIAEVLWNDFLRHNPGNPGWFDRDRFVLSNGHGSMLLYSLLHLSGYDLPLDEIKRFRQLGSKTPGHPELGHTPGVETTTGPLGQGLANGVGMAIAERGLAARFNRPGHDLIGHYTYVFAGDGCLMEGVSHEACSLAGTLGLGKLIVFYDDNGISIDGPVEGWFRDDTPGRFRAYGWHVVAEVDGHDPAAVAAAIKAAQGEGGRPSLIQCRTVIGYGAPNKQGTAATHGAPLGEDEVAAARQALDWPHGPFEVPEDIRRAWDARERGREAEAAWQGRLAAYAAAFPAEAAELRRRMAGELPEGFGAQAEAFIRRCQAAQNQQVEEAAASGGGEGEGDGKGGGSGGGGAGQSEQTPPVLATRKASQQCLEAYGPMLPELMGGSADLSGSNLTLWSGSVPLIRQADGSQQADGNYIHYGVREFGMTAIASGIALHGGFIPYSATFLIFMEYARNAVRMAALMGQRSILVYSHDSIGQGEDGPTHQPVEQLATLRSTPGMSLWRPCDGVETAAAWRAALQRRDGPTALVLSRQNLAVQRRDPGCLGMVSRGGYVLRDCEGAPQAIIIATGSEVEVCGAAVEVLQAEGLAVRLVSMLCVDVFEAQDPAYRESVLPAAVTARLAVEAGAVDCWHRFVGPAGRVLGMTSFGASAPGPVLMQHFGFTPEKVAEAVREIVRWHTA